jgi:hypothetical protein
MDFPLRIRYNPSEFARDSSLFLKGLMTSPWNTSIKLVFRAALLALLTGCGAVTSTNAPKPLAPGASSDGITVAPGGLQLGYIWHADNRTLYPILGVSGAAHYGSPALDPDSSVVSGAAATSASSSWGLMLHKDGALKLWSTTGSGTGTLAAGIATDAKILFSPSGTSAALISPSSSTGVIIAGLPSKPQIASVSLPAGFSPVQIAIGDDGTLLAGVTRAGVPGVQVGFLSETRGYTPIETLQAWGGAGFLPGSGSAAVIADGATGRLTYASNLNGASPALVALPASGLLQKPVAVGVSPDGKWAYAADSAKPQIVRVSIAASGPSSSIACACTPKQLVPLTTDGVFSLSADVQGQPAWILDTRTSEPRAFFVPALPGSTANGKSVAKASVGGAQ